MAGGNKLNQNKTMNRLKLYKAAHDVAFETLALPNGRELTGKITEAFKAAGFEYKKDFDTFETFFYDERLKMRNIAQAKLASEEAAEKV